MRLLFFGTPDYAVPVLDAVLASGHHVVGVYTRPDRPSGRGRQTAAPPVKLYAEERGLPVFQPSSPGRGGTVEELEVLAPDVIVVAAYGRILPPSVLGIPPKGALNIHPSLLPVYRGPSPVATAILDGRSRVGVTLMLMDEGMDTGDIVAQRETDALPVETAGELTVRLFSLGAELLRDTLPGWLAGSVTPVPQDDARATVTRLMVKEDGVMDWSLSAVQLERRVHAFDPWPGCYTRWEGKQFKVLKAVALDDEVAQGEDPGRVVSRGSNKDVSTAVVTGKGMLGLKRVQLAGGRPQDIQEFIRGHRGFEGAVLAS